MTDPRKVPTYTLNNGISIPCIGMGTFGSDRVTPDEVAGAVAGGLKAGWRLFDCAACYGNEAMIGHAFRKALDEGIVSRDDLFIMSKVWNDMHRNVAASCRKTIADLQCGYLDMLFIFGAIRTEGKPLPVKRHCFTSDLNGKQVTWKYSSGFLNTHLYIDSNYYRIRPIRQAYGQEGEDSSGDPLFEEPSTYIKIKEGMYLISFIENNLNKFDPLRGGNNLIILTNEKKMFDVGRTFCLNKEQKPDGGVFIAYGEETEEYVELAHVPSPYRV